MQLSALIVDDEPMARRRVADFLHDRSEITLLGECADGEQALNAIRDRRPDIVFLDIQMPKMGGFDVLAELTDDAMPEIVFTTAHDEFALQAFEVHAVDYLLKPYERERFEAAVDVASRRARLGQHMVREVSSLVTQLRDRAKGSERFPIKSDGRIILVDAPSIEWIEAANNYAAVHIGGKTHMVRETMSNLENRLPANQFLRLNRSTIVNARFIRELKPKFHGDYTVVLKNGTRLSLSRTHRDRLESLMKGALG